MISRYELLVVVSLRIYPFPHSCSRTPVLPFPYSRSRTPVPVLLFPYSRTPAPLLPLPYSRSRTPVPVLPLPYSRIFFRTLTARKLDREQKIDEVGFFLLSLQFACGENAEKGLSTRTLATQKVV